MEKKVALEVKNIHKRYGGIRALKGVDLAVYEGEICGLVGENGAGKSTLIKILTGVEKKDEGDILLNGKSVQINDPLFAKMKGIAAIYQELSLIERLTVAQNIFLGHEPGNGMLGWRNDKELIKVTLKYLNKFCIDIDPRHMISDLGLGEKKVIEILKALSVDAQILLLDEPTSGMSRTEIESLFKIIGDLKQHNVTMIYISHHLEEIFKVCDRVSVLRDGQNAGVFDIENLDTPTLVQAMIGKKLEDDIRPSKKKLQTKRILLKIIDFLAEGMKAPISFTLHKGEILGITGIIGSGKSELGRSLFGTSKYISGEIKINGKTQNLATPEIARNNGIAYIPEDRKKEGLFLSHSVGDNLSVPNLDKMMIANTFIVKSKKKRLCENISEELHVVPLNLQMKARNLSGGNQQKVVIGKWLLSDPDILIMDEPTHGVDVGVKVEVFRLIESLANEGKGIILISSEFDEIRRLCDRIIVLRDGFIASEMSASQATNDKLLSIAIGGQAW
ncbi:MAG TPA: sugar ABC transporter ATP-binding protein [Anaerolineae bacterium]|nr:sugar ABC transporter ATP-binding protein [Anaerolineae bacterium]